MTSTTERRLFVGAIVLVALPVAAAIGAAYFAGSRIARSAVEESLARSQSVHRQFQEQRFQKLATVAAMLSGDPAFAAYVAEATSTSLDTLSILDLLSERRDELGLDFLILVDPQGQVVARTDRPSAARENLSGDALVAQALQTLEPAVGYWPQGDRLYQAAVTPLSDEFTLIGALISGLEVDAALAREIGRVSGTEVAFAIGGPGAVPRLVSDADAIDRERLADELAARTSGLETATTLHDLNLDGASRVAHLDPLLDVAGRTLGATVVLTSGDRETSAFRSVQTTVLVVGLATAALALVSSLLLSRRLLRPVRRLAAAAEAAVRQDYEQRVPEVGDEEVVRMARAFNALLGDLRERREMQTYVADIARHLPAPNQELATAPADDSAPTIGAGSPGTTIAGRYRLMSILGEGGMGVVYQALDVELGEVVALKMLHARLLERPDHLERLKEEIRLARRITHPNVLRTFDFGEADGLAFITMEYVRGMTLAYLLRRTSRLPYAAGLGVARALCDGLGAAHAVGILHRDIKPANLILEQSGNVKLMDFGLAAPLGDGRAEWGGTPAYMAPEVLRGSPADARSDLYAAGMVLYEVFTGERPYSSASFAQALADKQHPPAAPSALWPEIPPPLERIILACMDPEPARRFADAAALKRALDELRH